MSENRMLDMLFEKLYAFSGRNLNAKEKRIVTSYVKEQELALEDEGDVEAIFDSIRSELLTQGLPKLPKLGDKVQESGGVDGSLQNLVTYSRLQPLLLKARKRMLGSVEPLDPTEVLSWLRAESEKETGEYLWVSYSFSLAVPRSAVINGTDYVRDDSLSDSENDREWFKHTVNNSIDNCYDPSEIHYSLDPFMPGGGERKGYVWQEDGRNHFIDMNSRKLIELAYWAERVIKVCPELHFQQAVQLILHGNMYSLVPTAKVEHRALETKLSEFKTLEGLPVLTYTIPYAELAPKRLAEWHSRVQKELRVSMKGRKINKESEILGIAAIQTVWVKNIERDSPAFAEEVLEQYQRIAQFYAVDPLYFTYKEEGDQRRERNMSKVKEYVLKVLKRLEENYIVNLERRYQKRVEEASEMNALYMRPNPRETATPLFVKFKEIDED